MQAEEVPTTTTTKMSQRAEKRQKTAADDVAESSFTKDLEVNLQR